MPLDFSKFRVKRLVSWPEMPTKAPPECWVGKGRGPWVPARVAGPEGWRLRVGWEWGCSWDGRTHWALLEGAGLTAFGCCFNIYLFIWLRQVLVAA